MAFIIVSGTFHYCQTATTALDLRAQLVLPLNGKFGTFRVGNNSDTFAIARIFFVESALVGSGEPLVHAIPDAYMRAVQIFRRSQFRPFPRCELDRPARNAFGDLN